jgi:hypothetical protein
MELKHRERLVQIKLVYYGPALGGKTTNLQILHGAARGQHRGEFISVNSAQDRTIVFDLLPLKGVGFHGFEIRFQLLAVPGQSNYAATRRLVMRGADAVVFVANSAADRLHDNVVSLRELSENLVANGLDPAAIPMVVQYNKRDLPEVTPTEEMQRQLNFRELPYFPAVAVRAEGVLETLGAIIEHTMADLTRRYRSLAVGPDQSVQAWTWEVMTRVFGRTSLAPPPVPLPGAAGGQAAGAEDSGSGQRRVVRVATSGGPGGAVSTLSEVTPDASLVESYAEASLVLGQALEEARDERERVQRRLDDLEQTFRLIDNLPPGHAGEAALGEVLEHLVAAGGGHRGSVVAANADHSLRLVSSVGLEDDPFVFSPEGPRLASQYFVPLREPALFNVAEGPELAALVSRMPLPVRGIGVVPVRSRLGLHGLGLLYYGDADPLPSPQVLTHLRLMGRAISTWFYASRARNEVEEARKILMTVAGGEAAHLALPEMEKLIIVASQFLRGATREAGTALGGLEQAAKALERAAGVARTVTGPTSQDLEETATRR